MPILSGTLRFWNENEPVTSRSLNRVDFVFYDTWEPSLIVEYSYIAEVSGQRVTYMEVQGYTNGLAIKVDGAEHAELVDCCTCDFNNGFELVFC